MGRYSQMYTLNAMSNGTNVLTPNLTREYPLKNFVINYDRTITPTLVNEFRLGAQIFPANDQILHQRSWRESASGVWSSRRAGRHSARDELRLPAHR